MRVRLAGLLVSLVLASCGGDGGGGSSEPTPPVATNIAPVANAGTVQNVVAGSAVTLDGSLSSDANGDLLTFAWTLTSKPAGSAATLASATTAKPTFTADLAGSYVASLTVSDGKVNGTTATVTVTAAVANVAPVVPAYTGSGLRLLIATDDGTNISVWPAETVTRDVEVSKALASINAEIRLSQPVTGVRLEQSPAGSTLSIDSTALTSGSNLPVTIEARNLDNGATETATVTINVLSPIVVASGRLTPSGGAVASPGGAIGLQVNPDQLSTSVGVTIRTANTPRGTTKIRMTFDRDVSGESAVVSLLSNRPALSSSALDMSRAKKAAARSTAQSSQSSSYAVAESIQTFPAYFIDQLGRDQYRLARNSNALRSLVFTCDAIAPRSVCLDYDPNAGTLTSSLTQTQLAERRDSNVDMAPVLFVHGYTAHGLGFGPLGGGEETWRDFPRRVMELPVSPTHVPFEFRWRTNASFRVVADELADAIVRIHALTGRPVRIIAHSFGGLLVRTLLQGQSINNRNFDRRYVRSVLTLGTPHSGVFGSETTIEGKKFPVGQDSWTFDYCNQISCHQAGETVNLAAFSSESLSVLTDRGERGALIHTLSLPSSTLPADLPFVVGIGLKRESGFNTRYDDGDGLISFNGQRYGPDLAEYQSLGSLTYSRLLDCDGAYGGRVKEVVLGAFDVNGEPDFGARPSSTVIAGARGYSHSASGVILAMAPDSDIEYAEPYVSCPDEACTHAALGLFVKQITSPAEWCEVAASVSTIPPAATLMGAGVALTDYYPNLDTPLTIPSFQTVGPDVEFMYGSLQLPNSFQQIIGSDADVGADYIDLRYREGGRSATGSFNGLVFDFDQNYPRIIGVSLDPLSTFRSNQVILGFDAHRVTINMSGVFVPPGARVLVRIVLEPSSPLR